MRPSICGAAGVLWPARRRDGDEDHSPERCRRAGRDRDGAGRQGGVRAQLPLPARAGGPGHGARRAHAAAPATDHGPAPAAGAPHRGVTCRRAGAGCGRGLGERWRCGAALCGELDSLLGAERLARRADKVGAKVLMHSRQLGRRVLALQRLVYDDGSLAAVPKEAQIPAILEDLQERIADLMARKTVADELERRVADRMRERQDAYMRELRMQLLQESGGPETDVTRRKLEELQQLERVRVARTALE